MNTAYQRLQRFLRTEMRMSHIYQPVMLRQLLINRGVASREKIARAILEHDPSQVEYYEQVVQNMVGRVLTSKADLVRRHGKDYQLVAAGELSDAEREELIALCDEQIARYLAARGQAIWEHRRRQGRVLSGSLRYEILKRARFRCELCGVSADERALEVDHIVPRNHGGSDDLTNLQALCYTCNASKRDRDDTDFRDIRELYAQRQSGCLFCETPPGEILAENALAYVRRDGFPVTHLHTLIIPKRHVASYLDLSQAELNAVHQLTASQSEFLRSEDATIGGFNVGVNDGAAAGQTVMHAHVHMIPRRIGDIAQPRGGIRALIPGKGDYGGG